VQKTVKFLTEKKYSTAFAQIGIMWREWAKLQIRLHLVAGASDWGGR
jgi:hypothetical protein